MRPAILLFSLAVWTCAAADRTFSFEAPEEAEAVAELDLAAPGADWAVKGREAALASITLDGRARQHVFVHSATKLGYRVFLGRVSAGKHELSIARDAEYSAPDTRLEAHGAHFEFYPSKHPLFDVISRAPVVYARRNTVGRFSDVPLLGYAERLPGDVLQYTIVFSNEDGGTSTRALMARWGRTTDIEYVYRVNGGHAIVQGPNHKDLEFEGEYDGAHPVLMPLTDNNMIGAATGSPLRFQPAPVLLDLTRSSRELIMDSNPFTYEIAAKELQREGKLRAFGTLDGENISDPRNYATVEYRATYRGGAFSVDITLTDGTVYSSDLGRIDYAIVRDGWVRTTVELPPGTQPVAIASVGFRCMVAPPEKNGKIAHSGTCRLEAVGKAFFLGQDYSPGPSWLSSSTAVDVPSGRTHLIRP